MIHDVFLGQFSGVQGLGGRIPGGGGPGKWRESLGAEHFKSEMLK